MLNSTNGIRQRIEKRLPLTSRTRAQCQTAVASASTHPLLGLQQQFGNKHVMRLLADRSRFNGNSAMIQRGDINSPGNSEAKPSNPSAAEPPLKEATVPIPPQHPVKASSPTVGTGGDAPVVPDQAKIRIPINFDFHLLPPELQIRLLDEFSLTAKVTQANLQWQRDRLNLGLNYEYGGALSGLGSYRSDFGLFSGKASYVPGAASARFDLGFNRDRFHAGAYATTGGEYGAGLSYGMKPLPNPDELEKSVRAGEQGARNVLNDLPNAADPTQLPDTLKTHKEDFKNIGGAVSPIMDLAKRDTSHIDWGFYLRFSKGPYQPSELYKPYFQQFEGQDEYKVGAGIVGRF